MVFRKPQAAAGVLLILGAFLINIPYVMLIMTFDYPQVLRAPAADILSRFAADGPRLTWTWLAFAWVGMPILLGILLVPRALAASAPADRNTLWERLALFFGAAGALVQMLGLLRWVFVVPMLARLFVDPQASASTRDAVVVVFQVIHSYGGVALGEHVGQTFTILWMILTSIGLFRHPARFPLWLPLLGLAAAGVYLLAQGELMAEAMPGFPFWGSAGLVGSLLWLAWLIAFGWNLIRIGRVPR